MLIFLKLNEIISSSKHITFVYILQNHHIYLFLLSFALHGLIVVKLISYSILCRRHSFVLIFFN